MQPDPLSLNDIVEGNPPPQPDLTKLKQIFTIQTAVLSIACFIIGFLGLIYFTSLSLTFISLAMKGPVSLSQLLRTTNSFFPRVFLAGIIRFCFLLIPLVPIALTMLTFIWSVPLGIVLAILTFFLVIAYLFFLGTRFLFVEPILFRENTSVIQSFQQSYACTGTWWALLLLFIYSGGQYIVNGFLGNPMYNSMYDLLWFDSFVDILSIALLPLYLILRACAATYLNATLFYSLNEFKGGLYGKKS